MKSKILLLVLCFGVFFFSFTSKKETTQLSINNSNIVNSLAQSTDYLKLQINSPMTLAEYTYEKNNESGLIKSGNKDIIFIPNKGQVVDSDGKLRPDIFYKASLNGVELYLTGKGMSFIFYDYEERHKNLAAGNREFEENTDPFAEDVKFNNRSMKIYRMDLDIVGINTNVTIVNEGQTDEYFNFYYGHCPEGITNVHGYRKVIFKNVYDNIDIVFHSNEKGLKYDFIVKPGGNVTDIELKFRNEDAVQLTPDGKIRAVNPAGEIQTDVLFTYQSDGRIIESNYKKEPDGAIKINTGEYDKKRDLVIDPYIGATYYGGNNVDEGSSITTDGNNNILVTGWTYSTNFPVHDPGGGVYFQGTHADSFDVFILKINSFGEREWATYYGGGDWDIGYSIATDGTNSVLVTGYTSSPDLPVYDPGGGAYYQFNNGGVYDAFLLKFNSSGVRQWATYYGGVYADLGYSITTDGNNNIIATGKTKSPNMPLLDPGGGAYYQATHTYNDAFILKFNSSGVRQWATYYGGGDQEFGYSATTDGNNNVLITGLTTSTDFPVYDPGGGAYFQDTNDGAYDSYILKFNSGSVRQWATYYGGDDNDYGYSINVDGSNNIMVIGSTESTNFPVQDMGGGAFYQNNNAGNYDIYLLKFNSSGIRQWGTYYGGSGFDYGLSMTIDGSNRILATGETNSTDFPIQDPGGGAYYQGLNAGNYDVLLLKFYSSGARQWATYYGGNLSDNGWSITTDVGNNILVTGYTESLNFPLHEPVSGAYYQNVFGGGTTDAFILGFRPTGSIGINTLSTSVPDEYALYQNYPNPFNPATTIMFDLRRTAHTKLIVYDMLGKEVATLVNEKLDAGSYEVDWDGTGFPSGVYFYEMKTDKYVDVKKMLMIK